MKYAKHFWLFLVFLAAAIAVSPIQTAELSSYNWGIILNAPPGKNKKRTDYQVLHFNYSTNKHYSHNKEAIHFVRQYMKGAKILQSDAEVLRYASENVKIKGAYIELGVCTGTTINFVAALNPKKTIYGFDSFDGLPEDWVRKDNTIVKGTFGFHNKEKLPPVLHNVILIQGLFEKTISPFIQKKLGKTPIALLHVDCDIYSSTKTALIALKDSIVPGTIIVFDEFYNYPGYELHEVKALNEFLRSQSLKAEYIAYNENHEQVAIRIKSSFD